MQSTHSTRTSQAFGNYEEGYHAGRISAVPPTWYCKLLATPVALTIDERMSVLAYRTGYTDGTIGRRGASR